jgi:hypothetical protein
MVRTCYFLTVDDRNTRTSLMLYLPSKVDMRGLIENTPSQPEMSIFTKSKKKLTSKVMNNSFLMIKCVGKIFTILELLGNTESYFSKEIYWRLILGKPGFTNTSTVQRNGLTKFAAESYMNTNGLPIK